ncbi:MAG: multifunctional CCA addition/repair protein [Rhizobacter sp.]
MKVWKVGGAVRDALLGRPVSDVDWVVTGTTPDEMISAGYMPVGRDFPVFLHPATKQEYALARTERSTAPGYHGFVFHTDAGVTLEEDLQRRDLTINAMAQDDAGVITDPYGGQRDLNAKLLRHVSPAFAEDPVRILRVARFAARFGDFAVADETQALMCEMVRAGEVDALVAERVWQELSRGLMEAHPSRMLDVLHNCGALVRLLPEVDADWRQGSRGAALLRRAIDLSARRATPLAVRFAVLTHRMGGILPNASAANPSAPSSLRLLCDRWRVPSDCREVAEGVAREHAAVRRSSSMDAEELVQLLDRLDAWRRQERFALMLLSCDCIACADQADEGPMRLPSYPRLQRAFVRAAAVDAGAVAMRATAQGQRGPAIAAAVHAVRVRAADDAAADEPND